MPNKTARQELIDHDPTEKLAAQATFTFNDVCMEIHRIGSKHKEIVKDENTCELLRYRLEEIKKAKDKFRPTEAYAFVILDLYSQPESYHDTKIVIDHIKNLLPFLKKNISKLDPGRNLSRQFAKGIFQMTPISVFMNRLDSFACPEKDRPAHSIISDPDVTADQNLGMSFEQESTDTESLSDLDSATSAASYDDRSQPESPLENSFKQQLAIATQRARTPTERRIAAYTALKATLEQHRKGPHQQDDTNSLHNLLKKNRNKPKLKTWLSKGKISDVIETLEQQKLKHGGNEAIFDLMIADMRIIATLEEAATTDNSSPIPFGPPAPEQALLTLNALNKGASQEVRLLLDEAKYFDAATILYRDPSLTAVDKNTLLETLKSIDSQQAQAFITVQNAANQYRYITDPKQNSIEEHIFATIQASKNKQEAIEGLKVLSKNTGEFNTIVASIRQLDEKAYLHIRLERFRQISPERIMLDQASFDELLAPLASASVAECKEKFETLYNHLQGQRTNANAQEIDQKLSIISTLKQDIAPEKVDGAVEKPTIPAAKQAFHQPTGWIQRLHDFLQNIKTNLGFGKPKP